MNYFTLSNFFKTHHLIAHLPLAFVALLVLSFSMSDKKLRAQFWKVGTGGLTACCFYLCASGLGLLLSSPVLTVTNVTHGILGLGSYLLAMYLFLQGEERRFFKTSLYVSGTMGTLMALTVVCGVLSAFGEHYFVASLPQVKNGIVTDEVFNQSVRPILEKKCVKCHNSTHSAGKLDITNYASLNDTYSYSWDKESPLSVRIHESSSSKKHMPQMSGLLSPTELRTIRHWIDIGGMGQDKGGGRKIENSVMGLNQWTFQRAEKPRVPEIKNEKLAKNEIDRFVFHNLEKSEN